MLTGLYKPHKGQIFFNDYAIKQENYPQYRNLIACVLSDNYLFKINYNDFDYSENNREFKELLHQMQLKNILAK